MPDLFLTSHLGLLIVGFILEYLTFFSVTGCFNFCSRVRTFLTAKYFGVRVETFCIGFGKRFYKVTRGGTTYTLALVPLGGYVKMYGDNPEAKIPDDQKKNSFTQPVWPQFAIICCWTDC